MASTFSARRSPSGPPRRPFRLASWLIFFVLIGVGLLYAGIVLHSIWSPVSTDKSARMVLVTIPARSSARQIGEILARKKLVRRAMGFVLAAKWAGVGGKMKAGRYELSPYMTPREIAMKMAFGLTANDYITIPEGFTVGQIAHRLAERHMADEAKFLALARTQGRSFTAAGFRPPGDNLEGYLFPDTYRIPKGTPEREIVAQMLHDFDQHVLTAPNKALIAGHPGGLAAAVNLASLVEREAETDGDRPLIAAALSNRLARGMRLQCDATVQYALPQHKTRLLYADLRVDSPYNTYKYAGLPPTPICSPGLPSIEAALKPAPVNYLFYVAKPDGSHIFSATLAEHDHAVAQMRALRQKN
ncbi:MAG: endolytic transglycosylase MltG [Armatimonadota bacterium]|nr:endolytic transglycosylase MltG [Armatimonadota bacterium]